MKPLATHEEFCLKNAAHFVAARVRTPASRIRKQFATLPEAQAFGAAIGDGRTMIYAVTTLGHPRLVTHIRRERGRGLAAAKKAAFIREHGRLFCERCEMDPLDVFGDIDGNACIEVHHREIAVSQMISDHETRLEDVQCLCANCHRYVHRLIKKAVLS